MIHTLAIENYRSLLNLVMPLGNLNVISGPNASGKSNLYRALRLLSETAQVWVVSHSERLISALETGEGWNAVRLEKRFGQTVIKGQVQEHRKI
jgi:predicted ATPase